MKRPGLDPTSIGGILLAAGLIDQDELDQILESQNESSLYELIGHVAVNRGLITPEQLDKALEAQTGLRSKSRSRRAMAQAQIVELSARLIERAASKLRRQAMELRQYKTGQSHPIVTPRILRHESNH